MRKTLAGDVLLILNKDKQDKTTMFSEKIRDVLCENVTINARIQLITLENTRLDETATKGDHDAVWKALGERHKVDLDAVLYVRLPIQAAKKYLEKLTIRVNWSSC